MKNTKNFLGMVTIFITLGIGNISVFAAESANTSMSNTDEVVCSINASFNSKIENAVSYCVDESGTYGPESFWIDEEGNIFLLDSMGNSIIEVKEEAISQMDIDASIMPRDIVCKNEEIYIYDSFANELQIYNNHGKLLFESTIPLGNAYAKELAISDNNVVVATYDNFNVGISNRTEKTWSTELETCIIDDVEMYSDYDFVEVVDIDESGNIYSLNTKIVSDTSIIAGEISICCMSPEGKELGEYILPTDDFLYLPEHFIRVMDNGDIYIMVPTEDAVEIRKVALSLNPISNFATIQQETLQQEAQYIACEAKATREARAVVSLTREQVLDRANRMATYSWRLTQNNVSTSGLSNVTLPGYIQEIANNHAGQSTWSVSMSGIPYCWGGFYSQYTGNNGDDKFADVISLGYTAGNVNTNGYYKGSTAGLDCSGYVSAAYGLSEKKGTGYFLSFGTALSSSSELETMDFFVRNKHVILFYQWINDSTVLVCETNVEEEKTVVHTTTINELIVSGGYQMRTPW